MNSRSPSGGAPASRQNASKLPWRSALSRRYSASNAPHSLRSAAGYPEKTGGTAGSRSSAGLHESERTQRAPLVRMAGKVTTLSSTITSGRSSAKISRRRGSTYMAPSQSAWKVGTTKSSIVSIVGRRKTGAVSRM